MDLCIDSTLRELGRTVMNGFEQRVASIPKEMCAPFHAEARQLEVELLSIYRMAVLCVRDEDDLSRITRTWAAMDGMCEDALLKVLKLTEAHPLCGADMYYDRILDLRNKCRRLQKMHA